MRVTLERALGDTVAGLIAGKVPDDEGLVAGTGQQHVGVLEGSGQGLDTAGQISNAIANSRLASTTYSDPSVVPFLTQNAR